MSTTTGIISDNLGSNVPKLDLHGKKWAKFEFMFSIAMGAKELSGHLDGMAVHPVYPPPATTTSPTANINPIHVTPEQQVEMDKWRKNEAQALNTLVSRLLSTTALRIRRLPTVAKMWAEVVRKFTEKGAYAQTSLRTAFLKSKCGEKKNVREFLEEL